MYPRALTRFIATALVALTCAAGGLQGQEVADLLKKAGSAYESGNYNEAITSLDHAGQLIQRKKSETLLELLPGALSGWVAETATSESKPGPMFVGGVSVQRRYARENAQLTMTITTDSPALVNFPGTHGAPDLLADSNATLESIGTEKAIVKHDGVNRRGELTLVVGGKLLITVEGSDVSRSDVVAYANALDYSKLSAGC